MTNALGRVSITAVLVVLLVALARQPLGAARPEVAGRRDVVGGQPAPTRPSGRAASRDPEAIQLGTARDRERVVAAARGFAQTFARYETGRIDRSVRLGLHRWATRDYAGELLSAPPRHARQLPERPARPSAARGIRVRGDDAWALVPLRRGSRRTALLLELRRAPAAFRVAGLR